MYKPIRASFVSFVLLVAGLLTLQGCGTGDISTPADGLRNTANFAITPIASPLLDGQSSGVLRLERLQPAGSNGDVAIRVLADGACSLKAAYFTLDYDAARFTPVAVETGPALRGLAAAGPLLELYVLDQPGRVYCGQCLAHWDKLAGFSGDGLVATVRFARRAFSATAKTASTPPDSALSQTQLWWDETSAILTWRFYNQGDYDQNGEVNIADLTPLGLYFGQPLSYPADENTARACADGDHNGELNIADLTPIGSEYGNNLLSGWSVYQCADVGQYPSSPTDDNGTGDFQDSVALADISPTTDRATDRLAYTFHITNHTLGDVFWLRPNDDQGIQGIASNYVTSSGTNHSPHVTELRFSAIPVSSGGSTMMLIQATDPDGDTLSYGQYVDAGVGVTDGDNRPESFLYTFPAVVSDTVFYIEGAVDDGHGGTASLGMNFTVVAPVAGNSPPTITSVNAAPGTFPSGGTSSVNVVAADVDGDTLQYTWMPGGGYGYFEGSGSAVTYHAPAVAFDTDVTVYVTVDDQHGHSVTDSSLTIHVTAGGANTPPTALLVSDPGFGPAPLTVSFDATGSTDTDGTITTYDWDWEGDGTYDLLDGGATPTYVYNTPGSYMATVRVTDDDGATGTDQDGIQVNSPGPTWHHSGVTSSSDIGQFSSLAEVGGCPAISYWDATSQNLLYVIANDALGAVWGTPVTVDNSGQVGRIGGVGNYTSMVVVQISPAIAYYRDGKLYYTRSGDGMGNTWNAPAPAAIDGDVAQDVGECASMALINGNPAISYYDRTYGDLLYIRANDGSGSAWDPPVLVDGAGAPYIGWSTSLADVGGHPMISYQFIDTRQLLLSYASDANGAAGMWSFVSPTIDTQVADYGTSLIDLGGLPAIAYGNMATFKLNFVRATDATLFAWITPIEVAGVWPVANGDWCSMKIYNGAPAISYFANGNGWLEFSAAADAEGNSWAYQQDVDAPSPPESVGSHTCLAIIGGNPAISYYDLNNSNLKFAIYY